MVFGKGLGKGSGKGRAKGGAHHTSGGKSVVKKAPVLTLSRRSGLTFPARRVINQLKRGKYADRVMATGGIYMAAVLEYLVCELAELAGNAARDNKRTRITPRHLLLAIKADDEFNALLSDVQFAWSGAAPTTAHLVCFLPPQFRKLNDPWTPFKAQKEANKAKEQGRKQRKKNRPAPKDADSDVDDDDDGGGKGTGKGGKGKGKGKSAAKGTDGKAKSSAKTKSDDKEDKSAKSKSVNGNKRKRADSDDEDDDQADSE